MVEPDQVRTLALALADVTDESVPGRLIFSVAGRGIAWTFMLRVHPKKPRVPHLPVLAVRCPIERKELLVEVAPDTYFDDDHCRGYPTVLVRLEAIDAAELKALLSDAADWGLAAPPKRPRKKG